MNQMRAAGRFGDLPGVPVTCEVHTTADPDPHACYRLVWKQHGEPCGEGATLQLEPRSGYHDVIFDIVDDAGRGIRFLHDPRHSFAEDPASPAGQIDGDSVSIDRRRLTVRDRNDQRACVIRALLRFDPPPFAAAIEIRNGGAGHGGSGWLGVIAALAMVMVAALVVLELR
ncbi:hypothetical protein HMF7854_01305 [Sphingomonas ginkgonis]|uniref:Uncharacterized protein n=1 Tax=Sphingomonas ginkgonis TaxID=2315330 RepID=A0A3R9YGT9_9SPHN|nr:hypothetical protein [Sphingomonas ginkgonis]RST29613.1 hypothetical protein HMF7854_01305 [Sphingomonas ginkgonis]